MPIYLSINTRILHLADREKDMKTSSVWKSNRLHLLCLTDSQWMLLPTNASHNCKRSKKLGRPLHYRWCLTWNFPCCMSCMRSTSKWWQVVALSWRSVWIAPWRKSSMAVLSYLKTLWALLTRNPLRAILRSPFVMIYIGNYKCTKMHQLIFPWKTSMTMVFSLLIKTFVKMEHCYKHFSLCLECNKIGKTTQKMNISLNSSLMT
jgi:hypothetical protein